MINSKILERIRADYYRRQARLDEAKWEENKHPRAKDGKFTSGSGSSAGSSTGSGKSASKMTGSGTASNTSGPSKKKMEKADMTAVMDKTDGGVSYPKIKKGSKWLSAIKVAQDTATGEGGDERPGPHGEPPKVEPGTWDKTIASLTSKDIVYQTDSDGNEVACVPGLAAKADHIIKGSDEMRSLWEKAVSESDKATKDMLDAAKKSGAYMYGLENSVKGASHFESKAQRNVNEGKWATVEEAAKHMNDAVRFTAMCDNDDVVSCVNTMCDELEKSGYEIVEVDNKFLNDDGSVNEDATYRAVHISVKNTEGRVIELQIHSPQSQAIKNNNHVEYAIQNKMKANKPKTEWSKKENERYKKLDKVMVQRWKAGYENPPGIETIKSFRKKE